MHGFSHQDDSRHLSLKLGDRTVLLHTPSSTFRGVCRIFALRLSHGVIVVVGLYACPSPACLAVTVITYA